MRGTSSCFRCLRAGPAEARPSSLTRLAHQRVRAASTAASPASGKPSAGASRGVGVTIALALAFAGAGYVTGSLYPPALLRLAFPAVAAERLDRFSEEGKAHVASVEQQIQQLPLSRELGAKAFAAKSAQPLAPGQAAASAITAHTDAAQAHYKLGRPYARYPEERKRHALTAGTLRGPGMIAVTPLVFTKTEAGAKAEGGSAGDTVTIMHLGRSVCGHDGVVHGGLIATIFDESLARTAFYSLPSHVGVTARLEVDYRKPTMADQFVRVECQLIEAKGRKATVRGQFKDMEGNILAEGYAIFVEPKFAKFINKQAIEEFLN